MGLTLRDVVRILECELITGEDFLDKTIERGCAADLMSDVLAFSKPGSVLLTGLTNEQTVRTADIAEVVAIVFVRGKRPGEDTIELAHRRGMPLLCTPLFMYEACGRMFANNLKG